MSIVYELISLRAAVDKQKAAGVYANPTHCRMCLQFSIRNAGSNNISFTREIFLGFRET